MKDSTTLFVTTRSSLLILCASLVILSGCESTPEVGLGGSLDGSSGDGDANGTGGRTDDISLGDGGENGSNGDGDGDNSTPEAVCGNGVLEPGEICDDGGQEGGDGCSADCLTQNPDFDCSKPGEPCVDTVVCGNGVIEGDEACDDGNTTADDGCARNCKTVEDGYVCARPDVDCILLPVCGNGVRERGEECDDADDVDELDGCHECVQADGYFCVPGEPCIPLICGDGNRTSDEGCDDGMHCADGETSCLIGDDCSGTSGDDGTCLMRDGDGCSAVCVPEIGWRCGENGCSEDCGDGAIVGSEQCDDGARRSGDGCSALCRQENFYSCSGTPSSCTSTISCGNGINEPTEVCDPGVGPDQEVNCKGDCSGFQVPGVVCGNEILETGELCEVTGAVWDTGCDPATCRPLAGWQCPSRDSCFEEPKCGDGVLHPLRGEQCDHPGSAGCSADCETVTDGWACSGLDPNLCVEEICGDGIRTESEECDEGSVSTTAGCVSCFLTDGWVCPFEGEPCFERCGDGQTVGNEECDDGGYCADGVSTCDAPADCNGTPGDNGTCVAAGGDGCNAGCQIEDGFACPESGGACTASDCGNGTPDLPGTPGVNEAIEAAESGEGCDDGNNISGDGCSATCQNEPTVTRDPNNPGSGTADYPDPIIPVVCGDGVVISGSEECDDGNTNNLDGCDENCELEANWNCSSVVEYPSSIEMQVTLRDFLAEDSDNGHPDFDRGSQTMKDMPGPVCTVSNNAPCTVDPGVDCPANTCGVLDVDGKPVHHIDAPDFSGRGNVTSADSYGLWYRDANPYDSWWDGEITLLASRSSTPTDPVDLRVFEGTLSLAQDAMVQDRYSYASSFHFPMTGLYDPADPFSETWLDRQDPEQEQNFHFTTELRYFFQYNGGETLEFRGDDDVWVFINGRLAVDIGGVHGAQQGRVVLGDDGDGAADDSDCSAHGSAPTETVAQCYEQEEQDDDTDSRFGLTKGDVYEIVLFHAERQTRGSNFNLTLEGFLAPRTVCVPDCGDGELVGWEVCDDGNDPSTGNQADPDSGQCNDTCTGRAYCGDGIQQPSEDCDNGVNLDLYVNSSGGGLCAPGCVTPPSCGDGTPQYAYEQCDLGNQMPPPLNEVGAYGLDSCTDECALGDYCGDGMIQSAHETCDLGLDNGKYATDPYDASTNPTGACSTSCEVGPHCGDGVRNGDEACDDGKNGDDADGCTDSCTAGLFCGDFEVTGDINDNGTIEGLPEEECDLGTEGNNGAYGGCTATCRDAARCGDGNEDSAYEECDLGDANNTGDYNGCTSTCFDGPRCGDGDFQAPGDFLGSEEECDNGFNQDAYMYSSDSCGADCKLPPSCGDGVLQSTFELCDFGTAQNDGSYDGCTDTCEWSSYCGDGVTDAGHEACDDGLDNTAYSADGEACGYDCQPAAYCGDGERNGPEQCDDGEGNNGEYGGCNADCTRAAYCGDGIKQEGEACDAGPVGSLECSTSCRQRFIPK